MKKSVECHVGGTSGGTGGGRIFIREADKTGHKFKQGCIQRENREAFPPNLCPSFQASSPNVTCCGH